MIPKLCGLCLGRPNRSCRCSCILTREDYFPFLLMSTKIVSDSQIHSVNPSSLQDLVSRLIAKPKSLDSCHGSFTPLTTLYLILEWISHNISFCESKSHTLSINNLIKSKCPTDSSKILLSSVSNEVLPEGRTLPSEVFEHRQANRYGLCALLKYLTSRCFKKVTCETIDVVCRTTHNNEQFHTKQKDELNMSCVIPIVKVFFKNYNHTLYIDVVSGMVKKLGKTVVEALPPASSCFSWRSYIFSHDVFATLYQPVEEELPSDVFTTTVLFPGSTLLRVEYAKECQSSEVYVDSNGHVDFDFTCFDSSVEFSFATFSYQLLSAPSDVCPEFFPCGDLDFIVLKKHKVVVSDDLNDSNDDFHLHTDCRASLRFVKPGSYWILMTGRRPYEEPLSVALLHFVVKKTSSCFIPFPKRLFALNALDVIAPQSFVLPPQTRIPFHFRFKQDVTAVYVSLEGATSTCLYKQNRGFNCSVSQESIGDLTLTHIIFTSTLNVFEPKYLSVYVQKGSQESPMLIFRFLVYDLKSRFNDSRRIIRKLVGREIQGTPHLELHS
ncbi:hypothetical protein P9112_000591 [Eukaryota sp. TZLM1-RC]